MRLGEQERRRRSRGAAHERERSGLGDRAEAPGDPERVVAHRRSRFDRDAGGRPAERRELRPADARG